MKNTGAYNSRCEKYFCRIEKKRTMEIIHRFLMRRLPEGTVIQKLEDFVYDMFARWFHSYDFGKVTTVPNFKNGHKRMPVTRLEGLSGSSIFCFQHSCILIIICCKRIEHSDFEDYIQDIPFFVFLWENVADIADHSNMDSLSSFIEKFDCRWCFGGTDWSVGWEIQFPAWRIASHFRKRIDKKQNG